MRVLISGGVALAGNAGFINAVALHSTYHEAVSHVTGTIARAGGDLVAGSWEHLALASSLLGGFVIGAASAGLIVGSPELRPGLRYGVALMLEALLLAATALLLPHGLWLGPALAATACGLQNGLASSYRGAIVRTTHMTGIATDLGMQLGLLLRERRAKLWTLGLQLGLLSAFFLGSAIGAAAALTLGYAAMWIPAVGTACAGGGYYLWRRHLQRPHAARPSTR